MRIVLSSVFVSDQAKALKFYTEVLGFVKKTDIPAGEYRWLTVASPEGPEGVELLLEPNDNPIAKTYQDGIYSQGIAAGTFGVDDIQKEFERMTGLGVTFTTPPTETPGPMMAVFDDTVGNLIQIIEV